MDLHRFTAPRANLSVEEKISHLQQTFNVTHSEALGVLNSCDEDLEQAVSLLWNMHAQSEGTKSTGSVTPTPGDGAANIDQATGTELNPIDLTHESGDPDLQQALALSIQQMNNSQQQSGLSIEEEELSRAVEASIAENNANLARLGMPVASVFVDPLNPHERKREGNTAVGLKNIGNTCWFSAVVQSLLHIPMFCKEILGYQPPPLANGITEYPPSVTFVLELQRLFAVLLLTPRKYIDPHFVIQAFKEVFTKEKSQAGAQQDVSEFTHKLLEWIEDAFRISLGENEPNPIVGLFTGHCKREGINNGEVFLNEEDFGALPIQVHNHTHLHDSLGAYTFNPEVNQETWFTHLPPVLVLSLSRFQYNQASGQAEKVHDRLKFDLQLSMDRYLETNKQESRERRKEVMKLKSRLQELKGRLNNYTQYNNKPVSVMESLSLTLKFIHEHEWCSNEGAVDSGGGVGKRSRISHRPSPRSVTAKELTTLEGCLNRWIVELNEDVEDLNDCISAAQTSLDAVYIDAPMNSTPYHLHAVLVHQGQASGGHYWAYVRKNHAFLKTQDTPDGDDACSTGIQNTSGSLKQESQVTNEQSDTPIANTGQYIAGPSTTESASTGQEPSTPTTVESVSSMENSPKSSSNVPQVSPEGDVGIPPARSIGVDKSILNQGMDMEGGQNATSPGSQSDDVWLKFNDVAVSEVTWEDVQKESYGEGRNTSAYCLIYINEDLHEQFTKKTVPLAVCEDLRQYVDRDATVFRTEISEYDERMIQAASHIPSSTELPHAGGQPPSPSSGGAPIALAGAARPDTIGLQAPSHVDHSSEQMQVDSPPIPPVSPHLAEELKTMIQSTYSRMATLYHGKFIDPRPAHIVTYAVHSGAARDLIRGLLLEMIIQHFSDSPGRNNLKILAQREFLSLFSIQGMQGDIDKLRIFYDRYCIICWNLIQAVKSLREQKWDGVLGHALQAYAVHVDICKAASAHFSLKPPHVTLLTTLRRKALQKVSDLAYGLFEEGQVQQALKVANGVLVPCLSWFSATTADNDEGMLEIIREKWCQCLVQPGLTEREQDQLADLLTRMFEESGKLSSFCEPSLPQDVEHHTITVELSNALNHLSHR